MYILQNNNYTSFITMELFVFEDHVVPANLFLLLFFFFFLFFFLFVCLFVVFCFSVCNFLFLFFCLLLFFRELCVVVFGLTIEMKTNLMIKAKTSDMMICRSSGARQHSAFQVTDSAYASMVSY